MPIVFATFKSVIGTLMVARYPPSTACASERLTVLFTGVTSPAEFVSSTYTVTASLSSIVASFTLTSTFNPSLSHVRIKAACVSSSEKLYSVPDIVSPFCSATTISCIDGSSFVAST